MASGGMGLAPFLWGEGGQRLSADEVARRRALAQSLIPQQAPRDYWSGINSIVGNIGGALHNWQADQAEAAGRSEYEGLLAQALESGATDIASLAPLLTHDFASSGGSALGQALLNQSISQSDPLYQARLTEAQLGLDQAQNPFQATPATPEQLAPWGIAPQENESWTIGPDGLPQQVYAPATATGDPFTLSPGQVRYDAMGNPIAAVPEGEGSISENERKVAALVERGFSQAEAEDLAYGFVQTVVDPVLQAPMIVNRTTREGRMITPEEAVVIQETMPEAIQSPEAATPQQGQATPSQFDAAFGAVDEAVDPALQAQMSGAVEQAQSQRPTLWEITESSTGIVPGIQEGWTNIAGQFGAGGFEDVVQNRQMFSLEKNNLIRALSINPRFPVGEMERLEREINITPGAFNSANSMRARMSAINDALTNRLQNEIRAAGDSQLPSEARRNALQAANDIQNFLAVLGVPEGADPRTGGDATTPDPSTRPPLDTFMRR